MRFRFKQDLREGYSGPDTTVSYSEPLAHTANAPIPHTTPIHRCCPAHTRTNGAITGYLLVHKKGAE